MKKLLLSLGLLLLVGSIQAQDASIDSRKEEVLSIINEHSPMLEEFQSKLAEHKSHLEERIIVLKYHRGNKEVTEACSLVVQTVEPYYNNVVQEVQEYQAVWFDQTRNITAIYTRYGELKEATGGGSNDLQGFVDQHRRYLELLDNVKSDLIGVITDLSSIKNSI